MSTMEQIRLTGESGQQDPGAASKRNGLLSYILGTLTTLLVVGGMQFLLNKPDPPAIVIHAPPTAAPTATAVPTAPPPPTATPPPWTVYISGAVQQPGLYQLTVDARLGDALALAGGLAANADAAAVNQAEKLFDGAHVHVPALGENTDQVPLAVLSGASAAAASTSSSGGIINLNTATLEQLDSLPGIGPSKAQAIIENRPYPTVDDLARVPGIGASTIEQLRVQVTVQ